MTTTTSAAPSRPRPGAPARTGVTAARVVRSEWIKLRTLRSTVWTLALTAVALAGMAVLLSLTLSTLADGEDPGMSTTTYVTAGVQFAQLALVVLGVLVVTGEYSTGMVRSTFTAVPTRLPVLGAKAVVTAAAAAVTSAVGLALAWVGTMPFSSTVGTVDLTDPGSVQVLGGAVLYLTTITLLAMAVGALLRHSAGAIATMMGLLLVVEKGLAVVPNKVTATISAYMPGTAGSRVMVDPELLESTRGMVDGPFLTGWQGYGVLVAWVVVLGTAAAVLLRRRDA